jgi:hypothetical protein
MPTVSLLRTSLGLLVTLLLGSLVSVDARRITVSPITAFVSSHQFASARNPVALESPGSTSRRIQQRQLLQLSYSSANDPTNNSKKKNVAPLTEAAASGSELDLAPIAFATPPEPLLMEELTDAGTVSDLADTTGTATGIPELPIYQLALAGSFTTFFTDVIMHPMDCIKTVQQSDSGVGLSLFLAAQYLWSTSGVAGFYHGFLSYALSDAVGGALKFSVWELWKKKTADWRPTYLYLWIGATLAFAASSVLVVPGEVRNKLHCLCYVPLIRLTCSREGALFRMYCKRNEHYAV